MFRNDAIDDESTTTATSTTSNGSLGFELGLKIMESIEATGSKNNHNYIF